MRSKFSRVPLCSRTRNIYLLTSFSNGDKFCKAVRYQQTDSVAPPLANPATHSAKEAYVGQVLTARHRAARLQWAQRHFRWGRQQWARVLFSDESRFNLNHHGGRIRVFRRRGERFADKCLIERDRFGGGSVMVWGVIMGRRKTNLIVVQGNLNAQGYINQILQPETVHFLQRHGPAILMHDNARPHVARICPQFLEKTLTYYLGLPCHRILIRMSTSGITLVERFELEGTYTILGICKTP